GAGDTLVRKVPAGFFQQVLPTNGIGEPKESDPTPTFSALGETQKMPAASAVLTKSADADVLGDAADPYAEKKRDLVVQSPGIMVSMESLLPFVYEDHRAENQALFASTLVQTQPLSDPIWGRIAFVLGAYGNYMYRYPLSAEQKQYVWKALLWAVFYERCYRRKYLAQRTQQLLHFLLGCAGDAAFQAKALK